MGFGDWLKDRAEIKAAENEAYDEEKVNAQAQRQRVAIEEAKVAGKERAHTGRKLPKPNPEKIAAIKSGLSKMVDKAATAGERVKAGEMFESTPAPQRKFTSKKRMEKIKAKSPEEEMNDYNKRMKETLGY